VEALRALRDAGSTKEINMTKTAHKPKLKKATHSRAKPASKPNRNTPVSARTKRGGKGETSPKATIRNQVAGRSSAAAAALPTPKRGTKTQVLLSLLERPKGATAEDMMAAVGWQKHSVRGFLAGTVKKKLGLALSSERQEKGPRRYRIVKSEE